MPDGFILGNAAPTEAIPKPSRRPEQLPEACEPNRAGDSPLFRKRLSSAIGTAHAARSTGEAVTRTAWTWPMTGPSYCSLQCKIRPPQPDPKTANLALAGLVLLKTGTLEMQPGCFGVTCICHWRAFQASGLFAPRRFCIVPDQNSDLPATGRLRKHVCDPSLLQLLPVELIPHRNPRD